MRKMILFLLIFFCTTSQSFAQAPTASASSYWLCLGAHLQLYYTGGIPNSVWEKQGANAQVWESFASANSTVSMLVEQVPGESYFGFRVKSPNGDSYIYSNIIYAEYAYSQAEPPGISGIYAKCIGDNSGISLNIEGSYGPYTNILWSTGATTTSITVNPDLSTNYTASTTDLFGCVAELSHRIDVIPLEPPVIQASSLGSVCGDGPVTLSFGGRNSGSPCTLSPNGQYPANAITPPTGLYTTITSDGHPGEYSLINVIEGKYYNFFTRPLGIYTYADYSTITNADGSQVYTSGFYGSALWRATYTGQVRFYSHGADCDQTHNTDIVARFINCYDDGTSFGPFLWMPGGQTTPSITVSPSSTTSYTLKVGTGIYEYGFYPCGGSATKQIIAGIGSVELSTTNITTNSAKLNWTSASNPVEWLLRYKTLANGSKWKEVSLAGNLRSYIISPLSDNQNYMWQIRAKCGKSWTENTNTLHFITNMQATNMNRSVEMAETVLNENIEKVELTAMPNPSNTNFRIVIGNKGLNEPVKLIVTDMAGRIIETRITYEGQLVTIGDKYKSGIYILRMIQGKNVKQLKLIKIGE